MPVLGHPLGGSRGSAIRTNLPLGARSSRQDTETFIVTPGATDPVVLLQNTAEGGTDGGNVTTGNSGGASGDAWFSVATAFGTLTYTTARAFRGATSVHVTSTGSGAAYMMYDFTPTRWVAYRAYHYLTANPTVEGQWALFLTSANVVVTQVRLATDGIIKALQSGGSALPSATFTNPIPLNQWVRLEVLVDRGSDGTDGTLTIALYAGNDTTPIETTTSTAVGLGTADIGRVRFGKGSGDFSQWIDDMAVGINSPALLGPSIVPVTATRDTTWDVAAPSLQQVTATRPTSWATLAEVSLTRASSWDVLTPVTSTRSTTADVLTTVTATRGSTWNVAGALAAVTATRATSWDALGWLTATRATTFDVRVAASSTRASTYRVLARATSSRATTFDTLGRVTPTRATTFDVLGRATATRASTWNVTAAPPGGGLSAPTGLTAVAISRSQITLTWDSVAGVSSYEIERDGAVIAAVGSLTYTDTGLAEGSAHTYRVRSNVSPQGLVAVTSSREALWEVRAQRTATRAASWDARTVISSTRPTTWRAAATTTATRTSTWDVLSRRTSSRATTWVVSATGATTFSKSMSGLYLRAGSDPTNPLVDLTRYNNNTPADHIFLTLNWATINGTVNGAAGTFDWSVIDNALAAAPSAKFTLRIYAGGGTPNWLYAATGGAVQVFNQARGITTNVPRWWTQAARDAWVRMINAAGARYDSNPQVTMVSAALVMVVWAEPFILGGDVPSAIRLYNAGLTTSDLQVQTIKNNVADTVAAFPNTVVELCTHDTLQYPKADGLVYSWPVGRQLMYDVALTHGEQICFTDYGWSWSDNLAAHPGNGGGPLTQSNNYAWLRLRREGLGAWAPLTGPVGVQYTLGQGRSGTGLVQQDYVDAAQNAVDYGFQFCETMSHASMSLSQRTSYDNLLKANQYGGAP